MKPKNTSAVTPEDVLSDSVNASTITNPFTGAQAFDRKGSIAATLKNAVILNELLLKRNFTEADEEAFQNLLRNVLEFRDLDLGDESGPRQFSFSTIFEFFKQKQQSATVHHGHYLAEGVTVSSFKPMRPIPFKAVFLLPLNTLFH